jgi:hypothetical protein
MADSMESLREALIDVLADAYAAGRVSDDAYDRLASAVHRAQGADLVKIQKIIAEKLRHANAGSETLGKPAKRGSTVDDVVQAFYAAISWSGTTTPSLDALRAVVAPEVRFVQGMDNMPLDEFWRFRIRWWNQRSALPFAQQEIAERTVRFGHVAHRLSVFRATSAGRDPLGRGVNSFQLVLQNGAWRIVSVTWQEETDDLPIPDDLI